MKTAARHRLVPLTADEFVTAVGIAAVIFIAVEVEKWLRRR